MSPEEKLVMKIDRLLQQDFVAESQKLTTWERSFLSDISRIYRSFSRSQYSTKGLSPKQKNAAFNILKKHGYQN